MPYKDGRGVRVGIGYIAIPIERRYPRYSQYEELLAGRSAHADATDYHASMVRLYDLPVRIVHGGHFPSYDGARHREIIRDWLDAKERG
ncbi:MAG: hypothetical protein ACU0A8_15125 [Limimaricola soesokkakensis]|uniref:hypothetical protein n=1 Tax=Limimaricola soesokkakensis TaxID=1343159 RepID=UPI0040592758